MTAADLESLWFVRYRIRLAPLGRLILPAYARGALLRGAFGITLRKLVCHDLDLACRACPLEGSCVYPATLEPRPPAGSARLSLASDLPRPFVFQPPLDPRTEFGPGDIVTFGLTAVGRAVRDVPYFVSTLRTLADEGIGPGRGRFELREIVAVDAVGNEVAVYEASTPLVRPQAPILRAADLTQPGDAARTRVILKFLTPLEIKDCGALLTTPAFGPIVRRLRDRVNSLAAFFGDGPLDLDWKGLSALADSVRLVATGTRQVDVRRRSSRTGQRHGIGGLEGEATFEGEAIGGLMPLVRLAEVVHVGKHAAFGNGWVQVAAL